VNQFDPELFTKLDLWLSLKRGCVISNNLSWEAEPYDEVFQKSNDYLVGSAPGGDSFNPLSKEICGS
jgi:hypothetical protein